MEGGDHEFEATQDMGSRMPSFLVLWHVCGRWHQADKIMMLGSILRSKGKDKQAATHVKTYTTAVPILRRKDCVDVVDLI